MRLSKKKDTGCINLTSRSAGWRLRQRSRKEMSSWRLRDYFGRRSRRKREPKGKYRSSSTARNKSSERMKLESGLKLNKLRESRSWKRIRLKETKS
jgi:hypothetical protein